VQAVVGILILLLGLLHFVDRDRAPQAIRQYYLGVPTNVLVRGGLALVELAVGAVVLLTA
jgi:hypothetical protein